GADTGPSNDEQLWRYFKSKKEAFPCFYKAYSHLRMKNWVVRSGAQYGVDFIVYRHHPARVHSEYGVLVLSHFHLFTSCSLCDISAHNRVMCAL
ncbi:tRNA-splicing endonuclease subunit Sen2-1-like, partial [Trifolium medium]|nr:tRNA-splicing endonuclease subunit Sen2-1-like [Trifolium medium]